MECKNGAKIMILNDMKQIMSKIVQNRVKLGVVKDFKIIII